MLSKTGETISSAVETNIHIPSRHLVCGLEVLFCVSVFLGKAGLAGGGVIRGTFSERLSLGPTWLFGCGSKLPWPSDSRGSAVLCVWKTVAGSGGIKGSSQVARMSYAVAIRMLPHLSTELVPLL